MKKKLQNVAYEHLPFSIHNHLFCCLRENITARRCRLCARYFIEDTGQASYLDFNFVVNKDDPRKFKVYSLIQDSVVGRFTLSIYYIVYIILYILYYIILYYIYYILYIIYYMSGKVI